MFLVAGVFLKGEHIEQKVANWHQKKMNWKKAKKDEKRVALRRVWAFAGDDKSVGRIKFTLISMEIYYYQN